MVQHKISELQAKQEAIEYACAANGKIWDEELSQFCSYRDLINDSNAEVRDRWLISGENEFGRLFRGFPPQQH